MRKTLAQNESAHRARRAARSHRRSRSKRAGLRALCALSFGLKCLCDTAFQFRARKRAERAEIPVSPCSGHGAFRMNARTVQAQELADCMAHEKALRQFRCWSRPGGGPQRIPVTNCTRRQAACATGTGLTGSANATPMRVGRGRVELPTHGFSERRSTARSHRSIKTCYCVLRNLNTSRCSRDIFPQLTRFTICLRGRWWACSFEVRPPLPRDESDDATDLVGAIQQGGFATLQAPDAQAGKPGEDEASAQRIRALLPHNGGSDAAVYCPVALRSTAAGLGDAAESATSSQCRLLVRQLPGVPGGSVRVSAGRVLAAGRRARGWRRVAGASIDGRGPRRARPGRPRGGCRGLGCCAAPSCGLRLGVHGVSQDRAAGTPCCRLRFESVGRQDSVAQSATTQDAGSSCLSADRRAGPPCPGGLAAIDSLRVGVSAQGPDWAVAAWSTWASAAGRGQGPRGTSWGSWAHDCGVQAHAGDACRGLGDRGADVAAVATARAASHAVALSARGHRAPSQSRLQNSILTSCWAGCPTFLSPSVQGCDRRGFFARGGECGRRCPGARPHRRAGADCDRGLCRLGRTPASAERSAS
jgi:hypothetical protein